VFSFDSPFRDMDWDRLRIFLAVARAGGFSKAVFTLNVTQSAISRQISSLEEVLKVKLFTRTHKGLELTESGKLLFETVSQVFDKLEDVKMQLIKDTREARGPLKVAISVSLGAFWLAPYLAQFVAQYPEINLTILAQDDEVDLSKREADVCIRLGPPQQQDLIQRQLAGLSLKLYASPEYIKAAGVPKSMDDLSSHQIIVYDAQEGGLAKLYREWLLNSGASGEERKPYFSINSMLGMTCAAEKGLGIVALFPDATVGRNLVPVLPEVTGPQVDVYYVYPERLRGAKKISVFGDFLVSKVAGKRCLTA
jgi:DNA-binding transcriptional LysR family regulator